MNGKDMTMTTQFDTGIQHHALRVATEWRIKMTTVTQVIQKVPEHLHLRFAVKSPILGVLAVILLAAPAGAQTMSARGYVTLLRTGWNSDSFAIQTSAPFINPAGCHDPDGYISVKTAPGYETYYDAAKLAYQMSAEVQVTVDNTVCISGRPKLWGINVFPPNIIGARPARP
jgi:hypothetical protein